MSVRHTKLGPLFIVGFGRSGTTILTQLVKKYLGVAFGTESQFIVRFAQRLTTYGDLHVEANRRRLLGEVARQRFFLRTGRNFGFRLDHEGALAAMREPTYAAMLDAIFSQLAAQSGCARWGDKTPEYTTHMPLLRAMFPEAQFIHMVRDGRDVALSSFLMHFGGKNAYKCGTDWASALRSVFDFAATAPAGMFTQVRYEDLMARPAETFATLIPFLGIEDPAGELRRTIDERVPLELKRENAYKWTSQMSPSQIEVFESVAGAELSRLGYERRFPAVKAPSGLARALWLTDHKLRQYARADYWADNAYRARLRLAEWFG